MMKTKGLTMSVIFEAESLNYGEGIGNVTSLKKLTRTGGETYTYLSRQALLYNVREQMVGRNSNEDSFLAPLALDKSVIQFAPEATIKDYAEIDLFGYMKTQKPTKTRSGVVRTSNAISLESFSADIDFLTNKGLLDRYNADAETLKDGGNISQSEMHRSYYSYTVTVDLDKVGIDNQEKDEEGNDLEISNEEKAERVVKLVDTLKFLYRDIKGRRENLSPLFVVGGVYDIKNPFFENKLKVENKKVQIAPIKNVLALDDRIKENTYIGVIKGMFENDEEMASELSTIEMKDFFKNITNDIQEYYKSC